MKRNDIKYGVVAAACFLVFMPKTTFADAPMPPQNSSCPAGMHLEFTSIGTPKCVGVFIRPTAPKSPVIISGTTLPLLPPPIDALPAVISPFVVGGTPTKSVLPQDFKPIDPTDQIRCEPSSGNAWGMPPIKNAVRDPACGIGFIEEPTDLVICEPSSGNAWGMPPINNAVMEEACRRRAALLGKSTFVVGPTTPPSPFVVGPTPGTSTFVVGPTTAPSPFVVGPSTGNEAPFDIMEIVPVPTGRYGPINTLGMPAYSIPDQTTLNAIQAFVSSNLNNPGLIAKTAQDQGLHMEDIAAAMGYKVKDIVSWFAQRGITRF